MFAFVSAPADTLTPAHRCSLANNQICGLDAYGRGTYTAEGITKLCEALKGSAVTSLECAATSKRLLLCQRPLTHLRTLFPSTHSHPRQKSEHVPSLLHFPSTSFLGPFQN